MKQTLFENMPDDQRKQLLEDNAAQITKGKYHRTFTVDEKNQRRKQVCDIDLAILELDEAAAAFRTEMKMRKDPLVDEKKKLLAEIKSNGETVEGNLYKMIDRENREVGFYNEQGMLVEQRRMTKEDNQLSIQDAFHDASGL